jgi:uncharacterized protein YkwD
MSHSHHRLSQAIGQAKKIPFKSKNYIDSIGGTNSNDYYQIRLDRPSHLALNLSGMSKDANLMLLNAKGRTIRHSFHGGQQWDSISLNLKQGTYYIQISRQGSKTQYQLSLSTSNVPPANLSHEARRELRVRTFIDRVLSLTNFQRAQAKLKPLRLNRKLNAAANQHSTDMARKDYFNHTGANGSSPFDRISATGYTYSTAAENIAAGFPTPESVVNAWMNSPGHRVNILNPKFQEMGVGYKYLAGDFGNVNYHHYWTQNFARPMA